MSELVGFHQLDRIIGFKVASYRYITTEMEGEQMMELLKAIKNDERQPDKDGRRPRRNAGRNESQSKGIKRRQKSTKLGQRLTTRR
jgi:hypothetical protein